MEILNSAKTCLKENGVLVYSTCTYNKRENEGVITKFIEENPDFVIEDSGKTYGRNTLKYAKRMVVRVTSVADLERHHQMTATQNHTNIPIQKMKRSILNFTIVFLITDHLAVT